MANSQDVTIYYRILKIPNHIAEPTAYELLGIPRFEEDAKTIKQAAMDRNALLQRKQNAENYEDVKRIEREVGEALVLLTNPEAKADYDRRLADRLAVMEPPPAPTGSWDRLTASFADPNAGTVEVEILPEDPAEAPPILVPLPKSDPGLRAFPALAGQKTKQGEKPTNTGGDHFLPGEAPWSSPAKWLQSSLFISLSVAVAVVFALGMLIAFWPSSSADDSPAENQTAAKEDKPIENTTESKPAPLTQTVAIAEANETLLDSKAQFQDASGPAIDVSNANRLTISHRFTIGEPEEPSRGAFGSFRRSGSSLGPAVISGDGQHIARRDETGRLVIYETKTGRARHNLPISVFSTTPVRFSSDGETLIAVQTDGWLSSWDVATGHLVERIPFSISTATSPQVVAISQKGDRWVDPGQAGNANVRWNVDDLSKTVSISLGQGNLSGFSLTPDGRYLAAYHGYELKLWDLGDPSSPPKPNQISSFTTPFYAVFAGFALSPDSETCALSYSAGKVAIYATKNGQELASFTAHTGRMLSLAFDPEGKLLCTSGVDGEVRLWNAANWSPIARLASPANPIMPGPSNADAVAGVRLTDDARQLVVLHESGRGMVWEVGSAENPQVIASTPASDLKISGPPQSLDADNIADLEKWSDAQAHPDAVEHVAFSADGKFVITAGSDRAIRFWDAQTGSLHHQVKLAASSTSPPPAAPGFDPFGSYPGGLPGGYGMIPSTAAIKHIAVSKLGLLAATADGRAIQLYDVSTGAGRGTIGDSSTTHTWFGFTPDGKSLITQAGTGGFQIWDVAGRTLQKTLPPKSASTAAAVAPDQSQLLLASGDAIGVITLWTASGAVKSLPATGAPIVRLEFSPDGMFLASYDHRGTARIHDLETSQTIAEERRSSYLPTELAELSFTPNGKLLLFLSSGGELKALSADPAKAAKVKNAAKRTGGSLLAVSPDGKHLVVAGGNGSESEGTLEFWGVGQKPGSLDPQDFIPGPPAAVPSTPSAHQNTIARDSIANIKLLASVVGHKSQIRNSSVHSLEFAPDGTRFVTGGSDFVAHVWDPFSSPLKSERKLEGHSHAVMAVAVSDSHIATACSKGYIKIWDRNTGIERPATTKTAHHNGSIQDLAFSPNGQHLASAGQDKDVKIWNVATMTEAVSLPQKHKATATGVTWVDNAQILSCDSGNRIFHWKFPALNGAFAPPNLGVFNPLRQPALPKATALEIKGFGSKIHAIASTVGNKAAFASDNSFVGLWNGVSSKQIQLRGHEASIRCLAFSPGGELLASAGADGTIRFWNTDNGDLLHTLTVDQDDSASYIIHGLSFSPDGRWLVTGDSEGAIKLWGLP